MRQRHTAEALATRLGLITDALFWHRMGEDSADQLAARINTILAPSDALASRNHGDKL